VPANIRAQFFAPAVAVFLSMALFGFYAALAPTILREDLHQTGSTVSGSVLFELCLTVALTVAGTRRFSSRTGMLSGLVLMLPSVGCLVWAQHAQSMPLLLLGTTVTGMAVALGYRGSLQVINQIAPAERRAEVVSSYLLAGFAGNSIPIIGVGVLASVTGPLAASASFAAVIALLALAAVIPGAKYAPL
jgi:MFS family permease